jgi:hypothetical protein
MKLQSNICFLFIVIYVDSFQEDPKWSHNAGGAKHNRFGHNALQLTWHKRLANERVST